MPYVFDYSEREISEADDEDMPPPHAADFVYLPPPDIGGAPGPVTFAAGPDVPADAPLSSPPTVIEQHASGLRQPDEQKRRIRALFDTALPHLRGAGIAALYVRYDGGGDEGFAWLDHAVMTDGRKLEREAVIDLLLRSELLVATGSITLFQRFTISQRKRLADLLDFELCGQWIALLLSAGFGTGEMMLYGAATIDLETRTITDDPKAAPIIRNIDLAGS